MALSELLPEYQCHKCVKAAKIVSVDPESPALHMMTPDGGFIVHHVGHRWLLDHRPEKGGYFVLYADGYASYSPKSPFESGYTLV